MKITSTFWVLFQNERLQNEKYPQLNHYMIKEVHNSFYSAMMENQKSHNITYQ